MFAEQHPFHEITDQKTLHSFILNNGRPKAPIPKVPNKLNSLIIMCWDQEPSNRPDILNVIKELKSIEKEIPSEESIKTPTERGW